MELEKTSINGTLIWYYYICKREVWLIAHGIEAEQDNDFIAVGRLIHEKRYKNKAKELLIDNKIKIDLIEN
ncbi:Dna2/Cas4 domain-containing protein, partial [Desulfurobacterium sp.]